MSYRAVRSIRGLGADAAPPPPDATGQALTILAISAVPCLPIAAGVASGFMVGKNKGAVAPIVGGAIGALISVLWLRSSVLAGRNAVLPRTA